MRAGTNRNTFNAQSARPRCGSGDRAQRGPNAAYADDGDGFAAERELVQCLDVGQRMDCIIGKALWARDGNVIWNGSAGNGSIERAVIGDRGAADQRLSQAIS